MLKENSFQCRIIGFAWFTTNACCFTPTSMNRELFRHTFFFSCPTRLIDGLKKNRGEPERACSWIPEKPERIKTIFDMLNKDGLVDRCHRLEARDAKREELLWLHDADHLDKMEASAKMERTDLNKLEKHFDIKDVYLCPETQQAALLAAGSGLQVVDSILSGESRSGVGVIRPPGHHADGHTAYGFCIYNNTALAAKYALEVHNLERVLIVDWDIHHGNGIQKMFEDDPRVLYISLHRLDTFPWDVDYADCSRIGTGAGTGYNVNIGWPKVILMMTSLPLWQIKLIRCFFPARNGGCRVFGRFPAYHHAHRLPVQSATGSGGRWIRCCSWGRARRM